MRYFDDNGNEVVNPDLSRGYGIAEKVFVAHHEAEPEIKETGHHVVVKEYPNGGKDVEWVVDVPGVPAKAAWDEYEDITRWHWYTEAELEEMTKPSKLDIIEAQVLFTALMTDTILEVAND